MKTPKLDLTHDSHKVVAMDDMPQIWALTVKKKLNYKKKKKKSQLIQTVYLFVKASTRGGARE